MYIKWKWESREYEEFMQLGKRKWNNKLSYSMYLFDALYYESGTLNQGINRSIYTGI